MGNSTKRNFMDEVDDDGVKEYYIYDPVPDPIPNPSSNSLLLCNYLIGMLSPAMNLMFNLQEDEEKDAKESSSSSISITMKMVIRKIGVGILGAVYAGVVAAMVMVLAMALGVWLVDKLVDEEPLFITKPLLFDYSLLHPHAFASLPVPVPVAHTLHVSLFLFLPDSDFNRQIGVFQLNAELISTEGDVILKSSQPCMLQFKSLPIRLMQTLLMGIPVLLGIASETQKMSIPLLKHKELAFPRTQSIRVSFISRPGTSYVPQLYRAEVLVKSEPPWTKKLIHNWKWTFYVWTSLYIYIMLLLILVCCFKPLIFPMHSMTADRPASPPAAQPNGQDLGIIREETEVYESIRRWRWSRSKRKAMLLQMVIPDTLDSSTSSVCITRGETTVGAEYDAGDSESVCFGGSGYKI